jgi:hypothetical protein
MTRPYGYFGKALALTLAVFNLVACGGGSGGGGSPTTPPTAQTPTVEDLSNASTSQLGVVFKTESKEVVLKWIDTFAGETGYRVERQTSGAAWQLQESLPAGNGTGSAFTWQRIIDAPGTYRVVAQRDGYVVPLQTSGGQSNVPVDPAATPPQLVIDQQEPVSGTAQVSVAGASTAQSVQYFADLISIGTSSTGPSFGRQWDSRTVPDGNRLLLANVNYASGLSVELRRPVAVDNPNIAVSLSVLATNGRIPLRVTATADAGVQSVEFLLNGNSLATLTASNDPYNTTHYDYLLDTSGMAAGAATIRVVATDNGGDQAEITQQINIDNYAVVTLQTPIDGAIVSGTLEVLGTVSDDLPGTVLRASLGDVQLIETTNSTFTRSYDLTGVPAGSYTLTVQAQDSAGHNTVLQRQVLVTNVTAFAYDLVGTYESPTTEPLLLLDTDAGNLLYRLPNRTVRRRQAGGAEVTLAGSTQITESGYTDTRVGGAWHIGGNYVTVSGWGDFGGVGARQTFLFDASGQIQTVPYAFGPNESGEHLQSALHGSWLVWGEERIYLRNLAAPGADVGPINGAMENGHAFLASPGAEQLFHYRRPNASATVDMYVYDVAGAASTALTAGNGTNFRPRADVSRVAWEKVTSSGSWSAPPFELVVAPVGNPTASTVRSTTMTKFDLADGLLAWTEGSSPAVLKVDDGSSDVIVATGASVQLYSTSGGSVLFRENGKLYTWSSAQNKRLLLDTLPKQLVHGGNVVFFTLGGERSSTIYRTTL